MQWFALGLAVYSTLLSTALGWLAWKRDRHGVRLFTSFHRGSGYAEMWVAAVNVGFRPVTLQSAMFEQGGGGGYLNDLDENLGLPVRLDEGQQHVFHFPLEDIETDTVALVVTDTLRREHRLNLAGKAGADLRRFIEHVGVTPVVADGERLA